MDVEVKQHYSFSWFSSLKRCDKFAWYSPPLLICFSLYEDNQWKLWSFQEMELTSSTLFRLFVGLRWVSRRKNTASLLWNVAQNHIFSIHAAPILRTALSFSNFYSMCLVMHFILADFCQYFRAACSTTAVLVLAASFEPLCEGRMRFRPCSSTFTLRPLKWKYSISKTLANSLRGFTK